MEEVYLNFKLDELRLNRFLQFKDGFIGGNTEFGEGYIYMKFESLQDFKNKFNSILDEHVKNCLNEP